MHRQGTMWYWPAVLAVLANCGLVAGAEADKEEAPKPLPPEIVHAWRAIGANVGWMKQDLGDNAPTFQVEGKIRGLTVFQFTQWKEGVLAKMPDPGAPFGLCLIQTKMTDAGLKELAGLKNLQALYLGWTEVTDAGLKDLAGLKSLRTLDVRGEKITDAGLKELAGLKNLQRLYLNHQKVTDVGLKHLAGLENLQTLNVSASDVTDEGLKELVGRLSSLQSLIMWGCKKATPAGIAELRKQFPQCMIVEF